MSDRYHELLKKYNLPRITKLTEVISKGYKLRAACFTVDESGIYLFFSTQDNKEVCCYLEGAGPIKQGAPKAKDYLNLLSAMDIAHGTYPEIEGALIEIETTKDK